MRMRPGRDDGRFQHGPHLLRTDTLVFPPQTQHSVPSASKQWALDGITSLHPAIHWMSWQDAGADGSAGPTSHPKFSPPAAQAQQAVTRFAM
jgi:hypothetical protein